MNRNAALHLAVAAVCGYEAAVIAGRRDKLTISALCRRYRWLGPVILSGLTLHFYVPPKPRVVIVNVKGGSAGA